MSGAEAVLTSNKYKYCLNECKREKWFVFGMTEMVRFLFALNKVGDDRHDRNSELWAILIFCPRVCPVRQRCVSHVDLVFSGVFWSNGQQWAPSVQCNSVCLEQVYPSGVAELVSWRDNLHNEWIPSLRIEHDGCYACLGIAMDSCIEHWVCGSGESCIGVLPCLWSLMCSERDYYGSRGCVSWVREERQSEPWIGSSGGNGFK